ncbi:MAG: energy coupling factor transporter S component ThiW [Candidatus Lokiarchaeota archaeon]|nr:energy coupling factor transporter S component ThiW [Candidatus Lokiarchaeota archaeon]
MGEKNSNVEEKRIFQNPKTIKVATTGIFIAVGLILSYLNPFAYLEIAGAKINPFAHVINAITGVLIGLVFSVVTALGIAILRFSLGIGTIHAFHGGMAGALVVGAMAYFLRRKFPKFVEFAALIEPLGTVFIGGTIAQLILPMVDASAIEGFLIYWGLFAVSSIPGALIGYVILSFLEKAGITWKDFD